MVSLIERRGYSRDGVFVLPEGWADAQELAVLVGKREMTVRKWLATTRVPHRRFKRVNAQGLRLGGHGVDGWPREDAARALQAMLQELEDGGRVNLKLKGVERG